MFDPLPPSLPTCFLPHQFRPAAILILGLLAAGTASATPVEFAAPVSGEKVAEYAVTLPVHSEFQDYQIPSDCRVVLAAQNTGGRYWGSPVEQRLWAKVISDCRYSTFLNRHPPGSTDFVHGYDFLNAPLNELPLAATCTDPSECGSLPAGIAHAGNMISAMVSMHAGSLPPPPPAPLPLPATPEAGPTFRPCRLVDGLFRGYLSPSPENPGRWRCLEGPGAPGFRVLSVDYGDVNGDGYEDAVLRLIPLGSGLGHAPRILPVTRFQADGPFVPPP